MDFPFASASLIVKIADLKKIESQLLSLGGKTSSELIDFLNHLQIGGSVETKDFESLISQTQRHFFAELWELFDEEGYEYLDLVFADEILTFLNLKLHKLSYSSIFKKQDYLHLSLKDLLDGEGFLNENYQEILSKVSTVDGRDPRAIEALLVKVYYDYLRDHFGDNPYLLAKEYAINTRTLFRSLRLKLPESEYVSELIGDDVLVEKYQGLYRTDLSQLTSALKEKAEPAVGELFVKMNSDSNNADYYVDQYLESKINDLLFSDEVIDLLVIYMMTCKRIIKNLKKVYYKVESDESYHFN